MKNGIIYRKSTILSLMGIGALFACQAVHFPEEDDPKISEHKLTVLTRSANQEFYYPVQVYAFNEAGACIAVQKVASKDESLSLKLPTGKSRIVAVSGSVCRALSESPTLHDVITMPEGNYLDEPLSMGQADVVMGEKSQTLNLLMSHRVSKLSLSLKQIPEEVTAVEVAISKPYSQLSLDGTADKAQSAQIPCHRQGKEWVTGTVYLLPTESQSVTFSISLAMDDKIQTYGYQHVGALEANTPYIITGTYKDGVSFEGTFIEQEWKDTEFFEFVFGSGMDNGEEQPETPSEETVMVDEIPETGSLWDGHVVADVEETQEGANLLLFGLMEWEGLTSANYEADPNVARRLAQSYSEGQLKGWRIPSKAEAQRLRTLYQDNLASLNGAIGRVNGTPVSTVDSKLSTVRYLCEDATHSFSFAQGTTISKAGTKIQTYRLRLVRTVRVKVE